MQLSEPLLVLLHRTWVHLVHLVHLVHPVHLVHLVHLVPDQGSCGNCALQFEVAKRPAGWRSVCLVLIVTISPSPRFTAPGHNNLL